MTTFSLHVHYHDEATEPALVLDAVRPAFAAVRPWTTALWFVRHWRRGPHLRLHFRTGEDDWRHRVRPTATRLLTSHLRAHPSTAVLDEAALAPVHEQLAVLEMESGPLRPWIPDNTVREQPYDQRLPVLGSARAATLLADFLSDTTESTFEMYAHLRDGGALPLLALDLMWTTVAAAAVPFEDGGAPIERGFLSLRSHADAFVSRTADPSATRAAFDARYRRQRTALGARLGAVLDAVEGRTDHPFVPAWAEAVRRHQRQALPLLARGEVSLAGAALAPRLPVRQLSEFHALLQSGHGHEDFRSTDVWFASFRLIVNYLYMQLNRLGLKPVDRALLCHLAACTVESVYGVSAVEAFRRHVVAGGPGEPGDEGGTAQWHRLSSAWAAEG